MRRTALLMSALLALGVTALAQTPETPAPGAKGVKKNKAQAGHHGVALATAPIRAIDAVVGLKDDQKTKLTEIQTKLQADLKAAPGDKVKDKEITRQANTDALAILTPEQVSKAEATMPIVTLLNSSHAIPISVFADVKLTDDQMSKIKAAAEDAQVKIKALPKEDRKTKGKEIRDAFKTTVDGILTADQKATIANAPRTHGKKKQAGGLSL